MKIKKYWCDPDEGLTSKFIKSIDMEFDDHILVTFEDGSDGEVYPSEIIDVLFNQNIELKDIIDTQYDWDVYLHHAGIVEFPYKGFHLCVMGEQSTFLNEERIFKHPELILEHKDKLTFGDSCWIEIIEDTNHNKEYDVFSSFKEAVEFIDTLEKDS